ncbi:hypothetical protein [Streptomyces sp. NBC_00439]|uniref:hypothetical protein n=1 Tax=Streptomyces sp. NBC_00439 TaxID=2903650 RepID=UPI0022533333|nr:hypothetical protein [Streptomyces sp. NBC_00439]MCX5103448.1 hypothetical protein [Streptomyces sp. NBC_00439]
MTKPTNPYAQAYATFLHETAEHELVMLHDDGLYRHLRIQKPGIHAWSWALTTWPGHLATSGDVADGYMFARLMDMLDFFDITKRDHDYYSDGAPYIDFRYWAEKICGGRAHEMRKYDSDIFLQHVEDALNEDEELGLEAQAEYEEIIEVAQRVCRRHNIPYTVYLADVRERSGLRHGGLEIDADDSDALDYFGCPIPEISPAERRALLLAEGRLHAESEHEARERLRDDREACAVFGKDAYWEWDLRDYDNHFLFTCYAIDLAVRLYREYEAEKTGITEQGTSTAEQISAVIEFAELGIARELGAIDARHHYTEEESAMMKARFDNAQAGIAAITALPTRSTETVQS